MSPSLHHSHPTSERHTEIIALFERTFTASEGAEEGRVIEELAQALLQTTAPKDLVVCVTDRAADATGAPVGAIIFSRLTYAETGLSVFVLGPVAVSPDHQGQGIGQALLRYGLDALRASGADVAVTYGDPNYDSRVGFAPISQDQVAPPFPLNYPEGWLGQSLSERPLNEMFKDLSGPVTCVPAFNDPAYW